MGFGNKQRFVEANREHYRARVLKLHQEGVKGTDIARRLDISLTAVYNLKKSLGLVKKKSKG